jgi:hypothetical protein
MSEQNGVEWTVEAIVNTPMAAPDELQGGYYELLGYATQDIMDELEAGGVEEVKDLRTEISTVTGGSRPEGPILDIVQAKFIHEAGMATDEAKAAKAESLSSLASIISSVAAIRVLDTYTRSAKLLAESAQNASWQVITSEAGHAAIQNLIDSL